MYSETGKFSSHDMQGIGNAEGVEEVETVMLENTFESKEAISAENVKELSTIGTQTPLTLIRLTVTSSSVRRQFSYSPLPATPTQFSYETVHNFKGSRENSSLTLSREVTTQATPPHPLLIPLSSQDTLPISTSFSSFKSGPKNEVITVTTDYGTPSPDASNMSPNADNQDVRLSMQSSYRHSDALDSTSSSNREATRSMLSTLETDQQRWSLSSCLHCASSVDDESDMYARISDVPPTYSTIFGRTTRNWSPFRSTNQSSFVTPIPPPSYAQSQGICFASYSVDQLRSVSPNMNRFWTARPTTALCPRCTTLVVTTVEVRQSIITHISAFSLFLCGCWPCSMLPYCMNTCKNIDHYCPVCHTHLGIYRPC